uniref:Uncharacterized protein n=1 Tax=Trypanosoma vivax (strain Y486) TaxID=1055687 RepID=G0TXP5_TRYVY|nr:hypothetical protein TVY486_0700790 [Trypanosoma vivax Y486]
MRANGMFSHFPCFLFHAFARRGDSRCSLSNTPIPTFAFFCVCGQFSTLVQHSNHQQSTPSWLHSQIASRDCCSTPYDVTSFYIVVITTSRSFFFLVIRPLTFA